MPSIDAVRSLLLPSVSFGLALLCGCGGSPTPTMAPSPYLVLGGNWEVVGLPATGSLLLASPIADFTGALESDHGAVSGTLRAFDFNFSNPCVTFSQNLYATGTLSPSGDLVLTIPLSGGTATITAMLSQNLQTYAKGTYQVSGGLCAMPSTTMAITQYAPVTGTYTGILTNPGSATKSAPVTAVLVQATTPDADGRFPLTGSVSSQGTCGGTVPLGTEVVSGNGIFNVSQGSQASFATITGPITPLATSIHALLTFNVFPAPVCGYLEGPLARQ